MIKMFQWTLLQHCLLKSSETHWELDLNKIAIPRVPGSTNIALVKNYIVETMKSLGFEVELDKIGIFENIVCSNQPTSKKRIIFAAHYDSLDIEGFIGAIDSAVPCAILLELARFVKSKNLQIPIDFVFFDGEEMGLLGSKHLAKTYKPQIQLFVLLDLIGSTDTKFYSYFDSTNEYYQQLVKMDGELFQPTRVNSNVIDDHIPFMERAPILHLIPTPFPKVWYTLNDNVENVDKAVVNRVISVLERFIQML
jgi:glutaminyl-peptide cyclotransferase